MKYLSLFKSKKWWLLSTLICVFGIAVCFALDGLISKSYSGLRAWEDTESTYVAYDARVFENDCYLYYGKNLTFNLEKEKESVKLPSYCYQFLPDVSYGGKSLLNEKNVIQGRYAELGPGEMAIPLSLSRHYHKNVGDSFYLNGETPYTVKYVTRDFYAIKEASINSGETAIFVGFSATPLGQIESCAVFDNVSREYNKVVSFRPIRDGFRRSFVIGIAAIFLLTLILVFYRKDKRATLNESSLSGDMSRVNKDLMVIDTFTIVIPFLIPVCLFLGLGNYWIAGIMGGLVVSFFVVDSVYSRRKVR